MADITKVGSTLTSQSAYIAPEQNRAELMLIVRNYLSYATYERNWLTNVPSHRRPRQYFMHYIISIRNW